MKPRQTLDLLMAHDHLELINPAGEGSNGEFVFVLIHDSDPSKQVRHLIGTLEDVLGRLVKAQDSGYGVFVIPHEARGRKLNELVRARCLVLDFDSPESYRHFKKRMPEWLRASMVLRTARGFHVYFECDPRDALWSQVERVRRLPAALAKFAGSDSCAASLNQPYRLAGFLHLKAERRLVEIRELRFNALHTVSELERHLPYVEDAPTAPERQSGRGMEFPFPLLRRLLRTACFAVKSAKPGTRFNTARGWAFRLGCYVPYGLNHELALSALEGAAASHHDPQLLGEVKRMLRSVLGAGEWEGLRNPPTPTRAMLTTVHLQEWAEQVACRVDSQEVRLSRLLSYNRGWKPLATRYRASRVLSGELRKRGYVGKNRRQGRRVERVFIRDPSL